MATKKITLNELRSIVKQIIKEEMNNKRRSLPPEDDPIWNDPDWQDYDPKNQTSDWDDDQSQDFDNANKSDYEIGLHSDLDYASKMYQSGKWDSEKYNNFRRNVLNKSRYF